MGVNMSNLVVKDNSLIQASYFLDLTEQRLILLAIIRARETGEGISHDSLLCIHGSLYAKQFNINLETAYSVLKDASKSLFTRYVTYHDKNPTTGNDRSFHCRWVDKIGYEKDAGNVYLRFTKDVVPLITRLEQQFTSYDLAQVSKLTSAYAIRLYELLIQWRTVGKTPVFELQEFRLQLGVEKNQYTTMSNFKKNVLDFSVSQVNEFTDIVVKYEQQKDGRSITGFKFIFKQKSIKKEFEATNSTQLNLIESIPNAIEYKADSWLIKGLTDPQIKKISIYKKEFIDANSKKISATDSRGYNEVFESWRPMLKDPQQVSTFNKIKEILERQKNS